MAYRYAFIDPFVSGPADSQNFASALQSQQFNITDSLVPSFQTVSLEPTYGEFGYAAVEMDGDEVDGARELLDSTEHTNSLPARAAAAPPANVASTFALNASVASLSFNPSTAPASAPAPSVLIQGQQPVGPFVDTLEFAGKGVVAASSSASRSLIITLSTPDGLNSLVLAIGHRSLEVGYGSSVVILQGAPSMKPFPKEWVNVVHDDLSCWLRPGEKTTYWVSLDEKNGSIKYGKYYLSANLKLLEVTFKKVQDSNPVAIEAGWEWMKDLRNVTVQELGVTQSPLAVSLKSLPIVHDIPPYVVTADRLSLADLEANIATVAGNLPEECQKLYANVAGANIVLNTPDFPDFDEAIQYSVNTPGCVGHRLLTKKSKGNFAGTYLRITIGFDVGTSPGVPYVLEIWPAGHHSPIHDHGNSFAVIKVLSGRIFCYYYDTLRRVQDGGPRVLAHAELRAGDITWMSNDHYQVHQLKNRSLNGRVCVTLQCYQYGANDKVHDEYFHFLSNDPSKPPEKFDPKSDMSFSEFKKQVQAEWEAVKARLLA